MREGYTQGQNFLVVSIFISSFQKCDAVIVTASYAYESVSLNAVKQWFSDAQKEVHVFGPPLLRHQNAEQFLDLMHTLHSITFRALRSQCDTKMN
jgi:hypothetical protein